MRHALKLAAAAAVLTTAGVASAQMFTQTNRVFLPEFDAGSSFGTNPASIAFDGTTAYIGGLNSSGATATAGVVSVTNLYGTFATSTNQGLASTVTSLGNTRGYESLAFASDSGAVILGRSTGGATGDVVRYNPGTDSIGFTAVNPSGARPFVVGVDPIATVASGDSEMAAYLTQNSGRRRALDIDDGSVIFDGTNGAVVFFDGALGSSFRGMDFDSEGNLALATSAGFSYYTRAGENSFTQSSVILTTGGINNIGQDVAILEGAGVGGTDLLAVTARGASTLAGQPVSDNNVYITTLTGTILQTISGDESGLSGAFSNNTRALDYALDEDGNPTLVISSFVERRLDVYQIAPIPEPASLGLLSVAGLGLLRRRK